MINSAVILAGGLGTRLKGVINEIPKPMAPIGNKPFLALLLDYLQKQGVRRVILAVGYKYEVIEEYFGSLYKGISIDYSVENEPLGTGGAIAKAIINTDEDEYFLLNGDTFFDVNLKKLYLEHKNSNADLTLSLKAMKDFDRYGSVMLDGNRITAFDEKKYLKEGFINGGVYVLTKRLFTESSMPNKFSFEKDIMEQKVSDKRIYAYISNGYFIDIGIPEDYTKAQRELSSLI